MNYLVIEGNIASGKTTLANMLAKEMNANLMLEEFTDNPFLPKFYKNPDRYSFPLELSFLADRYNQVKRELLNPDLFQPTIVSDYYFSKTSIFAKHTLKSDEYILFQKIYDIILLSVPHPSVYVYLNTSIDRLLDNITIRGRDFEEPIDATYLERVQNAYMSYMKQITKFPVVIINTSTIDFVNNKNDFMQLKDTILKTNFKKGINYITIR